MTRPSKIPGLESNHHGRPMNRRDLFAQGLLSMGGYVVTPSIFAMMSSVARGEASATQCAPNVANSKGMLPIIVIDLVGGGNIAGTNIVVGGKGGQMDYLPANSYASIGLSPAKAPGSAGVTPVTEFGLAFHPDSKMLRGMRTAVDVPERAKVDGVVFCAKTADDNPGNPLNPLYWIVKGGAVGELTSIVGTEGGVVGGNSKAPDGSVDPRIAVQRGIKKPEQAAGLVDPGRLAQVLAALSDPAGGKKDADKVLKKIQAISESSLANFQQKTLPAQVQTLVNCGYLNAAKFLEKYTPQNLNPSLDTQLRTVFPQVDTDPGQQSSATIAKLVLDGYAAGGTIVLGGYDYHGADRAGQNAKDEEAGLLIGRIIKLAAVKNKSVMIYVITDGGVSSPGNQELDGIYKFAADSGERSSSFALVYKATPPGQQASRPEIRDNRRQIGAFNDRGAVDLTAATKISDNAETLTRAFIANYLALHGREGDLAKVVGNDPFGAELNQYLAFGKLIG